MSEVVEYPSRDYNRRRLLQTNAPMVISNMIGISASLVPAWAIVQPPPPPLAEGVGALPAGVSRVAVTEAAVLTSQGPVPVHPFPLQPVNTDPALGVAVSVTVAPPGKRSLQSPPQSIPAGVDATVPAPVPFLATMRVNVGAMEFSALNAFNRRPLDTLSFSCDEASPAMCWTRTHSRS